MSDSADRVLEYALRRVLSDDEPRDLSEDVLRAWARGVRGSLDVEELLSAEDELGTPLHGPVAVHAAGNGSPRVPAPAGPRPAGRRAWPLAALAASSVAAVGIWWMLRPDPGAAPALVTVSGDAWLLRGDAGRELLERSLEPGDRILVDAEPVELRTSSGAMLRVDPGSALRLALADPDPEDEGVAGASPEGDRPQTDPDADLGGHVVFELAFGTVHLTAGAEPPYLSTGFAEVRPSPNAALSLYVDLESSGDPVVETSELARLALAPDFSRPRTLSLAVTAGTAELLQGDSVLALVPRTDVRLAERDLARFDELFETVFARRKWGVEYEIAMGLMDDMQELAALLSRSRPLWSRLEERLTVIRGEEPPPPNFTAHVLDFLSGSTDEEALEIARRLWLEEPWAFAERQVVALAELGAFEFEREVRAAVANGALPDGSPPVLSAAFLAFRGDPAGRDVLSMAAAEPIQAARFDQVARVLESLLGLDALGEDDAWPRAQTLVRDAVEDLLARFEVIAGARLVLIFEAYSAFLDADEPPQLGRLPWLVNEHAVARSPDVQSEAEVRALLDALAPE